jgi:hypothetical protein
VSECPHVELPHHGSAPRKRGDYGAERCFPTRPGLRWFEHGYFPSKERHAEQSGRRSHTNCSLPACLCGVDRKPRELFGRGWLVANRRRVAVAVDRRRTGTNHCLRLSFAVRIPVSPRCRRRRKRSAESARCAKLADSSLAMMRVPRSVESTPRLLPEGRRWGFGAHSLVPYLTIAMQARPADGDLNPAIRNPVFPAMDEALRPLRQRH